uniref:Putative dehydrogenase with different specificities related to short-chain alcohol dehydrogenase n=1 Tax=Corethrella appendiculata TaxID=1370023 RepID=U5ESL3_9DIPT
MVGIILLSFTLVLIFLIFFFMRSTKEMPKNWSQFKSEIKLILLGTVALAEDILLRKYNKIELYKQPHKVALITGGNRGIGLRIVKKLIECEITVILGVRNPDEAKKTVEKYLEHHKLTGKLHYEKLDIGDMTSVKQFAEKVKEQFQQIHILINNAGVMSVPFRLTADGFESHMAINYVGHFLLTHLLMPLLRAAGTETSNARIINVSSCVHKVGEINYDDFNGIKNYYPADAYNQSKLAQVMFTRHLNIQFKLDGEHLQSHSLHPGVVNTDLFENSSTTYIPWIRKLLFKTPEQGAITVIYAAISPAIENDETTYFSNCRAASVHRFVKNSVQVEKLFRTTCDMLGIKDFFAA